jgi:crossover junction endodeoxyribonuclease RuvC
MTAPRIILGIDLGLDGAVAELTSSGELLAIHDMPTLHDGPAGRRSVNAILLSTIIAKTGAAQAYVEYVGARPGEAPSGAFSFGRSRGVTEGICATLNVHVVFLTPPQWHRRVSIPAGTNKDLSRSAAIARWPSRAEWFALKKWDGRSDAALIALAGLMIDGSVSR